MARDMNFTIGLEEIWGGTIKFSAMDELIKYIIIDQNFVDIFPSKIDPTWDNGWAGNGYVEKILDRFLVHENIMDRF